MWWHWQNLNEKADGTTGWPYHGRCWLHWGERSCAELEWVLWGKSCHLSAGRRHLHVAFPPVALYLSLGDDEWGPEWSVRVHDWAVWFCLGADSSGWSSSDPWWWQFSIHPLDILLGRQDGSREVLESRDVEIPMPEGVYRGVATLERWTRGRKRWLKRKTLEWRLNIDGGIPHAGKGENSWDCGDDGLWGIGARSRNGKDVEVVVARAVEAVMERRRRYGQPSAASVVKALRS